MRAFILIALIGIISVGCKKSQEKLMEEDYIIFGSFYGMCLGEECREMFMLADGKLYEDIDDGSTEEYVELSEALYAEVMDIETAIPDELIALSDSTFGCPDCHDQGGVVLKIKNDDVIQQWRIDNDLDAIPTYLHAIVDLIHEKIELINE